MSSIVLRYFVGVIESFYRLLFNIPLLFNSVFWTAIFFFKKRGDINTCPPFNSNLKALKFCLSLSCYSIYSIDRFVERRAACSVNCYRICHHLYCITKDLRDADFIFLTLFRQWMMFWGSCIKGSFNSLNSVLIWLAVGSQWEKRNTVMQSQHYLPAAWILNLFPINIWLT